MLPVVFLLLNSEFELEELGEGSPLDCLLTLFIGPSSESDSSLIDRKVNQNERNSMNKNNQQIQIDDIYRYRHTSIINRTIHIYIIVYV